MTGAAPIYLVSACSSGEEFIAAFRRYADRHGLFVPISEPLAIGRRGRFAVTLRDGGVMIEGEAEVINSARTASVLHGRVGMTLRFLEPDEASKTTLGELERARLAMKPPPPSLPPRPAQIPAEPRPVPPPVQGRIDAVNALAQCVAIGDPEPPPHAAAPVRHVVKTMIGIPSGPSGSPGRARSSSTPPAIGSGATSHSLAVPRTTTAPLPSVAAMPADRNDTSAAPPGTPSATPPPDVARQADADAIHADAGQSRTLLTVAPDRGPTSDTFVAVAPPLPPLPPARPATASAMAPRSAELPAIPRTGTTPGVAPLSIAPLTPSPPISETMTAVPVPSRTSPSAPTDVGGALVPLTPPDDPSIPITPTEQHDDPGAQIYASAVLAPAPSSVELGAMTPGMPSAALEPAPPVVAPARLALSEIEICEPTDVSMGPPEPMPADSLPADSLPADSLPADSLPADLLSGDSMPPEVVDPQVPDEALADAAGPAQPRATDEVPANVRIAPRGTVLGVAPLPRVPPSSGEPSAVAVPSQPPPPPPPVLDELTPSEGWTLPTGSELAGDALPPPGWTAPSGEQPAASAQAPAAASAPSVAPAVVSGVPADPQPPPAPSPGSGLPSGDWLIARDPDAPDGWTAPLETTSGQSGTSPAQPDSPPLVASMQRLDSDPRREPPHPDAVIEPKVQIDPTLIEPLQTLPPLEPYPAAPMMAMPGYPVPGAANPAEAPPMNFMMAVPLPSPYMVPQVQPMHAGHPSGYAMDPGYQMMAGPDPRYGGGTALPASSGHRGALIVLVIAIVAVVIGIVAVLAGRDDRDAGSQPSTRAQPRDASRTPAATPPPAAQPRTESRRDSSPPREPPDPRPDAEPAMMPATPPAAVIDKAAATPPEPRRCFAEISSVPLGADILIDQTTVIGTTPQKVPLPCGGPVEIVIRKGRLVPAIRTITPTPEGVKVRVALAKPTFLVKVSSNPPGATITLYGKSLGVTPTTVKIPAKETSTLTITKDGYATATERVSPKANGITVHKTLNKLERTRNR